MYRKKAFNLHFSTFFTPKRKNPRDSVPLKPLTFKWVKKLKKKLYEMKFSLRKMYYDSQGHSDS